MSLQILTILQDLYKQLATRQPQPDKYTVKTLISNAAYEKIDSLKKERSHLINKVTSNHPSIALIDEQKKQLEALISRNRV